MNWYVAHLDTQYCGTDNFVVFEANDDYEADSFTDEFAFDNACQYFQVVADDEYARMEEDEDVDESHFISDEEYYGSCERYDPKIHNEYLEAWQIDEVNA